MRSSITIFFVLFNILLCFVWSAAKKLKDEDFSEFDDFDEDEFIVETPSPSGASPLPSKTQSNQPDLTNNDGSSQPSSSKTTEQKINDDVTIDDDDDLIFDEEEFEASDSFTSSSSIPDLKIAEVPANLTGNRWEAYHCEAIMIIALLIYLINFLIGRSKKCSSSNNYL
ncbi:unnamed protein product [Rotaria sp. Silwood1]|nr:unnamed protein product [Rotaria sp. Silwood1]